MIYNLHDVTQGDNVGALHFKQKIKISKIGRKKNKKKREIEREREKKRKKEN